MKHRRPLWAEVNLSAIRHNMSAIKSLLAPKTQFCPIIKADGYGHGALALAKEAALAGADRVGVALLQEGIELRNAGFTFPILILSATPQEQLLDVVGYNLTQTIYSKEHADALSQAGKTLGRDVLVHIKVDTGMSRIGVSPAEALALCQYVISLPHLCLEGIFTHFATSDSLDKTLAQKQFSRFTSALDAIKDAGITIPLRHCANSAATLDMPEMHLDMVRPGIILYGLWPSSETTKPIELKPAMRLKARFSMVKEISQGAVVSYGATYQASSTRLIGTIPAGYADGYTRMLSGKAEVVVAGKRAPIAGRICMDQCMADITGISGVNTGDEVLLFGGKELPVEEIATHLNTINYEVVCMVGKRVPRVYVEAFL